MKKITLIVIPLLLSFAVPGRVGAAHLERIEALALSGKYSQLQGQAIPDWITKLIKIAVDQVLKAMNLVLMRLQNKQIDLMNAAKLLESTIHSEGMQHMLETGKKMKALYEQYYDELQQVKEIILTVAQLKDLVEIEKQFLKEYVAILDLVKDYPVFTPEEIALITQSSLHIFNHAEGNIADIEIVLKSFTTTMSDADRLLLIRGISRKIEKDYSSIRQMKAELVNTILWRTAPEMHNLKDFYYTNQD